MSGDLPGLGHNNGPSMDRGVTYRRYLWNKARKDLVPTLPLFVLKMRVQRARELGLDYKTYAGVRASTGRDVIGFLFSSNALRMKTVRLDEGHARALDQIKDAGKVAMVHHPLVADEVAAANVQLDAAYGAPKFTHSWTAMRDQVRGALLDQKLPRDGVLVIGDTTLEREWADAGRTAGYLPADRYFGEMR
ncbi:hypothetical protein [Shimia ponticola]|uniref:hypothetical protein n=1 Tax=Shimia ponticola TaxID=2582893 RepID=UPI0011BDF548|nr:hypothetical protein [Shimia ponticola]